MSSRGELPASSSACGAQSVLPSASARRPVPGGAPDASGGGYDRRAHPPAAAPAPGRSGSPRGATRTRPSRRRAKPATGPRTTGPHHDPRHLRPRPARLPPGRHRRVVAGVRPGRALAPPTGRCRSACASWSRSSTRWPTSCRSTGPPRSWSGPVPSRWRWPGCSCSSRAPVRTAAAGLSEAFAAGPALSVVVTLVGVVCGALVLVPVFAAGFPTLLAITNNDAWYYAGLVRLAGRPRCVVRNRPAHARRARSRPASRS